MGAMSTMRKPICRTLLVALLSGTFAACATGADDTAEPFPAHGEEFKDYWYRGTAEITRYELEQARYGETHRGDAVLIFVTEDFLPGEQVKYEGADRSTEVEKVLKLNATRKFATGIYPYSIMTSVFTPVEIRNRRTLKATASIQEWCGHTYTQLNYRKKRYEGVLHSYFQDEADERIDIGAAMLEDEVWTRIRLDPSSLPVGEIEIVPGLHHARMLHRKSKVEKARAERLVSPDDAGVSVYRIEYRNLPRKLEIRFESKFPHGIVSWEEADGPGAITRAEKTHTLLLDYWNKNSVADSHLRRKLGLR